MAALLAAAMFVVALVFSMLGQGGGALYTPLQVWLGIGFHQAATTSLFLIVVTSLSASLVFHRAGKIDLPLAIVLESVTAAGGFLGGLGSDRISGTVLTLIFAVVIGTAAIFMIRPLGGTSRPVHDKGAFIWQRTLGDRRYSINLALALPVSFGAGIISGMVGVGGGLIKVPVMVLALGVPMDIAVGSSALMVGLTAGAGFAGHLLNAHWDWRLSLILAVAVFAGGQIGSRITVRLDKAKLKRAFGVFLIVIALTMVIKALA